MRERVGHDFMATIMFFVVVAGGSAYAAATIGSSDIKDNAVLSRHIKDGAVTGPDIATRAVGRRKLANGAVNGAKVADRSLTGADIKASTLGTVPRATNAGLLGGLPATAFQQRVSQGCPGGNAIASIATGGTVACRGITTDEIIGGTTLGDHLPSRRASTPTAVPILIIFAGSGYRTAQQGAGFVSLSAEIDGYTATSETFTNETVSHKATVPVVRELDLNAGSHTLNVFVANNGGTVNGDDRIELAIFQLPQ